MHVCAVSIPPEHSGCIAERCRSRRRTLRGVRETPAFGPFFRRFPVRIGLPTLVAAVIVSYIVGGASVAIATALTGTICVSLAGWLAYRFVRFTLRSSSR